VETRIIRKLKLETVDRPETFLLVERNLVGKDVKASVDLRRVGADHLDVDKVGCEVDGQTRLAGVWSRADDGVEAI
jgi:hypothetical protein